MDYKEICSKYPEIINKGRKGVEANVLGSIFKDILLIDEYDIPENLFISDEGKLYYSIAKTLSSKKINTVSDTDIRLNCSDDIIEYYKKLGGFKRIDQFKKISCENFNTYYDELNKKNLYMKLCDDGFDLEKEITIKNKNKEIKISYINLFETQSFTTEQCINFIQSRILECENINISNNIVEESSEITDDFINRLSEGMEQGTGFAIMGTDIDNNEIKCFPWVSNHLQGFSRGKVHLISAHTNMGKSTVLASIAMAMVYSGEKVMFCSNEMGCDDFRLNFLSLVISRFLKNNKLHRKKLKKGNFTEEELKIVKEAQKIFNERYAKMIDIVVVNENSGMDTCEKYLRKYSINKGTSCLIYDVFKLNFDKGDAGYLSLIEDSLSLETMTKKYDVISIASMQLALNSKGKLRLGNGELSNAKGVSEILTTHLTMRNVEQFELDQNGKYYIRPFRYILKENGSWDEEEFKLDNKAVYRCIEIAKSRQSETSEDTGICCLYKFYGGSGSFVEVCLCRPYSGFVNQYANK